MTLEEAFQALTNGEDYCDLPEKYRMHYEVANYAVTKDMTNLYPMMGNLLNDKDFVLQLLERQSYLGSGIPVYLPEIFLDDPDVMLATITKDSSGLAFASDRLKRNYAFMTHATILSHHCFYYADEHLKNDREFTASILAISPDALDYSYFKDDMELVLVAVKADPTCIGYASPRIQNLCKGTEPAKAIESHLFKQKLEKTFAKDNPCKLKI